MKTRRFLSLFLAVILAMSVMPTYALAADTTGNGTEKELTQQTDTIDMPTVDTEADDSPKQKHTEIGGEISGDEIYYDGDVVISERCSIKSASVKIAGDVIIEKNLIIDADAEVEILGDLHIQCRTEDGDYDQTSAAFTNWGYVLVHGDVYAQTTSAVTLVSGSVLELKGNLMQIGSDTKFQTSNRKGLILFSGENEQNVYFDRLDSNAQLGCIEVKNRANGLYLATPVYGIVLTHDTTLISSNDYSDISVPALSTNGYLATIEGNLVGTSYFVSGDYFIVGNVIVEDGLTISSDADMEVLGDLSIQSRDENGNYTETAGSFSNYGKVLIHGNAYVQTTTWVYLDSASYLEIEGTLTQIDEGIEFLTNGNGEQIHFSNEEREPISFTYVDSTAQLSMNSRIIWDSLKSKGLNDYAVAGIMGNLYAESALSPINLENKYEGALRYTDASYTAAVDNGSYTNFVSDSAGYGLAQWTYCSRKKELLEFARSSGKSIGDIFMQVDFLWEEMQNYGSMLSTLRNANSILSASNAVLLQYERPADQSIVAQLIRTSYAQVYYDMYA